MSRRDELVAELRSLDTSVMDTWDREQLEQEYITASESLGWCEYYMKEWERQCDEERAELLRIARRHAVVIGVLAAIIALNAVVLMAVVS